MVHYISSIDGWYRRHSLAKNLRGFQYFRFAFLILVLVRIRGSSCLRIARNIVVNGRIEGGYGLMIINKNKRKVVAKNRFAEYSYLWNTSAYV